MVDPKNEPGFQQEEKRTDYTQKEKQAKQHVRTLWRERMRSKLVRMSRGAQNLLKTMTWPKGDNWRRKDK